MDPTAGGYQHIDYNEVKRHVSRELGSKSKTGESRIFKNICNKISVTINQIVSSIQKREWINDNYYADKLQNNIELAFSKVTELKSTLTTELSGKDVKKLDKYITSWESQIADMQKVCKLLGKSGNKRTSLIESSLKSLGVNLHDRHADVYRKISDQTEKIPTKTSKTQSTSKKEEISNLKKTIESLHQEKEGIANKLAGLEKELESSRGKLKDFEQNKRVNDEPHHDIMMMDKSSRIERELLDLRLEKAALQKQIDVGGAGALKENVSLRAKLAQVETREKAIAEQEKNLKEAQKNLKEAQKDIELREHTLKAEKGLLLEIEVLENKWKIFEANLLKPN